MVTVTATDDLVTASGDLDADVLSSITGSLSDVEELPTERTVPNARQTGKRGRSAFAGSICEYHPTYRDNSGNLIHATLENPCAKFSNLPGNGVGPYKPSIFRKVRSFFVGLVKPVLLIGFVLLTLWCAKLFLPHIFSLNSFVPGSHVPNVTNTNSDSNGNGNGVTGHKPNESSATGQRKSPANHKLSHRRDNSSPTPTGNARRSRS
jgi:hypothetical protein